MPATYEPIATTTLGSNAATIDFTSISSAYTDLRLVLVWRSNQSGSSANVLVRVNSDSGSNYSVTQLNGDGSSASSFRATSATSLNMAYISSTESTNFGLVTLDFMSYAGSTNKTILGTNSYDRNGSGYVQRTVGLWRSTSAITSVNLLLNSTTNYVTGTTATLYGILKA